MKQRCYNPNNPNYHRYGGRGIRVCQRWRDSCAAFVADMGPRPSPKHTVDRIDNDGNYEPGNVRWATMKEQHRNRHDSRTYTHAGRTQSMGDWAKEAGMHRSTLEQRIKRLGWSFGKALTAPVQKQFNPYCSTYCSTS